MIARLQRRMGALEADFRRLHAEFRELKANPKPVYVDLGTASKMYGIAASTLRFRCNTGAYQGIAMKEKGKWLLNTEGFEKRLSKGLGTK
jgi:hypothetical protein